MKLDRRTDILNHRVPLQLKSISILEFPFSQGGNQHNEMKLNVIQHINKIIQCRRVVIYIRRMCAGFGLLSLKSIPNQLTYFDTILFLKIIN